MNNNSKNTENVIRYEPFVGNLAFLMRNALDTINQTVGSNQRRKFNLSSDLILLQQLMNTVNHYGKKLILLILSI